MTCGLRRLAEPCPARRLHAQPGWRVRPSRGQPRGPPASGRVNQALGLVLAAERMLGSRYYCPFYSQHAQVMRGALRAGCTP